MIKWLQRQSAAVRVCFAFGYCAIYYGLHFLSGVFSLDTVTTVLVTVFPILYGAATQLLFDPLLSKPSRQTFQLMVLPVVLLCVVLLFWQFETLICIAILLPIFMALGWFGQWIMRVVLRKALVNATSDTLNVSLLLLPTLAVPLFGQFEFPQAQMQVTTQFAIEAPKDVVWANTIEIDEIQAVERVWTFSHNILGTPRPIDAVLVGDVRKLRWTGGIVFEEHLTALESNTSMTWDFVFNAPETLIAFDPHIAPQGGIVNMQSGSYHLTSLPNGVTLLTLETNYSIRTPVNTYLAIWGEVFLQDFHHAVLSVIKTRSEKG